MTLKLPTNESFAKIPWLSVAVDPQTGAQLHAAFEWQYLAALMFKAPAPLTFTTSVAAPGFLSTKLPGFDKGAACVSTLDGSGTGDTNLRSFLTTWQPTAASVRVRASFARRCVDTSLGSSVDGGFRGCAIYARGQQESAVTVPAQGVANAGTVQSEHVEWINAYALVLSASSTAQNADLVAELVVTRVLGINTEIYTLAHHEIPLGVTGLNLAAGIDVSMKIVDTDDGGGPDPYLTCRIHGYNLNGRTITATLFSTSVIGGTVTHPASGAGMVGDAVHDGSAYAIRTTGATGFGLYPSRDDTVGSTAVDITEGILQFEVKDIATESVIYADDFTRVYDLDPDFAGFNQFHRAQSVHGDEGTWINSLWAFGSTAATDNTSTDDVDPFLGRSTPGATGSDPIDYGALQTSLVWPSTTQPLSRDFYSLRPADYSTTQHRSIEIKPFDHNVAEANWTAAVDKYGVLLRGSTSRSFVARAFVAYLEPVFTESGLALVQSSLTVHLAIKTRTSLAAAPTYKGLWSKTVTGVDLADAAWHTLDYNCHLIDGAQSLTDPIVHTVKLNGVVVVFDTIGTYGVGTYVMADGRVIDGVHGPTTTGHVEGVFVESTVPLSDASANILRDRAQIRNWTQGTLVLFLGEDPIDDQPSHAWISDEGASTVTGDLSTVFESVFPQAVTYVGTKDVELRTEIGLRLTRARSTRTRRRWRLNSAPLSSTARTALDAFWGVHGVTIPFNWTPDGETAVVAYFADAPKYSMISVESWRALITIEELLT